MWRQLIVNGMIAGSTYGLVALGFSLIYSVDRFFNFAHGVLVTAPGYVAWMITVRLGFHIALGIVVAIIFTSLLAIVIEYLGYRPLRRAHASSSVLLLASLGIYVVIQNLISLIFGDDVQTFLVGSPSAGKTILGIHITPWQIAIVAVNVFAYLIIALLLKNTRWGIQMRALASDSNLAQSVGLEIAWLRSTVVALAAGFAAIAGILVANDLSLAPTIGFNLLLMSVTAVIVGGIGNILGAAIGSMFVGIAGQVAVSVLPSQWEKPIVFLILILFLLLRPQGFFGTLIKRATV
jgi:branched-chain amino acid transport system permease protein